MNDERNSLRIILAETGSITLKHWKYFKCHNLKYESIVKENVEESLIVEHHAVGWLYSIISTMNNICWADQKFLLLSTGQFMFIK